MSPVTVELENKLTLDAPVERVWDLMSDVPQVVPCIPGGRLVETVDDATWKAEVALDLGFTRVVFLADVVRRELDRDAGRAVLEVSAVDSRGKSSAKATMTSVLKAEEGGTAVSVATDMSMDGEVARFGPGIIEDVSYEIVEQMTACIEARLAQPADASPAEAPTAGKLSLWVAIKLWVRGRLRRWRAARGKAA